MFLEKNTQTGITEVVWGSISKILAARMPRGSHTDVFTALLEMLRRTAWGLSYETWKTCR